MSYCLLLRKPLWVLEKQLLALDEMAIMYMLSGVTGKTGTVVSLLIGEKMS